MEYLTGNQYFASRNENKTLLNKLIVIDTDNLDFREGHDESKTTKGHFNFYLLVVVFVCSSDI